VGVVGSPAARQIDVISRECSGAGTLVWRRRPDGSPNDGGDEVVIVACEGGETLEEALDRLMDLGR
jgi:hypothetical protein